MINKLLAKLGLIGALLGGGLAAEAATPLEHERSQGDNVTPIVSNWTPSVEATVRLSGEADKDAADGVLMASPNVVVPFGNAELRYNGTFRKPFELDMDSFDSSSGHVKNLVNEVSLGLGDLTLGFGRSSWRHFFGTSTTTRFDDRMAGPCGFGRSHTGIRATYGDFGVGVAASNGKFRFEDMNTGVLDYVHQFGDLGFQLHVTGTEDHLIDKFGCAWSYKPSDTPWLPKDSEFYLDTVFGGDGTAILTTAGVPLTPSISLFAGANVNIPDEGRVTEDLIVGMKGDLGHGFSAFGGLRQEIAEESATTATLGFVWKRTM